MTELKKELSLFGLVMIAIGASVGVGIFKTPTEIAFYMKTPALSLAVWVLGGVITLAGALTFAELGGLFYKAGGIYIYLKEAYGELVAFLYGWLMLLVINTGSLAALAITFSDYFIELFPVGYWGRYFAAILAIVLVTIYNVFSTKISEFFSNIFTGLKILGILILASAGLYLAFYAPNEIVESPVNVVNDDLSGSFALALVGVLFSYGGWQHISFLSGETQNAAYKIPRAMVIGVFCITIIYLLVNISYLTLLPIEELATSKTVASDTMERLFPRSGSKFMALVIAVSVFGTMGIYTLSAPRIFFAMAKDGLFFQRLANVHPKYGTPVNAIVLQSTWAIFLIFLWGKFEDLTKYVVFIDYIFFFLAAFSIFIFRKKLKNVERTTKAWGYPFVPAFFCSITAWFTVMIFLKEPVQALAGLGFLVLGVVFFYLFRR
jgi:basic amino acid/polyamine antiporter, APA family